MEPKASRLKDISERLAALSPEQRALVAARVRGDGPPRQETARIPRREAGGPLPLSFAQQRLWFLQRLDPSDFSYNVSLAVRLKGRLDAAALGESLNEIVKRHEVLRTSFSSVEGEPRQTVTASLRLRLAAVDLSDAPHEGAAERARRLAAEAARRPFDLTQAPLLKPLLIRLGEEEHVLSLTMHHIVCDGWSLGVFARELGALYNAFSLGSPPQLPELPVQYADFAAWQRERLSGELLESQLAYWRRQLDGQVSPLELPADRPRTAARTRAGARRQITLAKSLTEALKELSRREGATLFMTLLAAFQALLHRYTGRDDVTVGAPIANRTRSEVEPLIGFFVNTLLMRTSFAGDPTFRELLARVRETALGAYAHQDLPFEKLVEELQPERGLGRTPLFNVSFALQNAPAVALRLRGLTAEPLELDRAASKFDLNFQMSEEAGALRASATYATDLFEPATVERMLGHFRTLLEAVAADPARRVSELPLLTDAERRQLIFEWNDTATPYPRRSVKELFEAQAERRADEPAVVFGEERLTYGELNRRANRLAHHLSRRGVGPEVRVGVLSERSPSMVLAWLAVLKAGGAYVHLDPSNPPGRIRLMLEDAGVSVLLTEGHAAEGLPTEGVEVVSLGAGRELIARASEDNPPNLASAESAACVIYTSGSTGRPKGVSVPHRAIVRLVCDTNYVSLDAADGVAQAASASFDAALFEVWGALVHGARLVGIERELYLSPRDFAAQLRERRVTVMFLTTALFNQIAAAAPSAFAPLRCLLFGGEKPSPQAVREVLRAGPPRRLLHVYGPTEGTTFASWHEVRDVPESAATIPIGLPVSNTRIHVLDERLRLVPAGVPGELYIGGDGLARGYLDNPRLTAERFLPDPFGAAPGARLYRTGDIARRLSDGRLEFIERRDAQVKLRGHRVEPGEIESALCAHPAVKQAAVLVAGAGDQDRRLVAYVACDPRGEETLTADLRAYLKGKLPDYMLPAELVLLDALPLTPNGKVDRRSLSSLAPVRARPAGSYEPPRGPLERRLAEIWEEVLGVRPVGVRDNFFDLGGHSLLAASMMDRVERLCGRKLPLAVLFEEATVEHLARAFGRQPPEGPASPLLEVQRGGSRAPFFFLHGDYSGGGFYCLDLARRLGAEQPFYALPPHGHDGATTPPTVEEMAARHLAALRAFRPEGPYLLGGYCNGALVAFEMARQLTAQGERVDLLVLIHAAARRRGRARFLRALVRRAGSLLALRPENELRLWYLVTPLGKLSWPERGAFLLGKAGRALRLAAGKVTKGLRGGSDDVSISCDPRRGAELDLSYLGATHGYVPKPYPGRVTLLWPEEAAASVGGDPTMGWRGVAAEVEVRAVPGDHATCITLHQEALAGELRSCLRRLEEQPATDRP
ncbi:MAG TPA: amino acid adenylation domain-containing protein [Pyrinomonadaceae bacterium]|nr:amino acid adenylation domain-containing protein [Pyrinomonadaceae bacterium]